MNRWAFVALLRLDAFCHKRSIFLHFSIISENAGTTLKQK